MWSKVYAAFWKHLAGRNHIAEPDQDAIPVADGWHPYFQLGAPVNDTVTCSSDLKVRCWNLPELNNYIDKPTFAEGNPAGAERVRQLFRYGAEWNALLVISVITLKIQLIVHFCQCKITCICNYTPAARCSIYWEPESTDLLQQW